MNLLAKLFPRRPPLDEAFDECHVPQDVCAVIRKWIEPVECTDEPTVQVEKVWRRGYGDCDDLARLTHYGCRYIGARCDIWYYWPMYRCKPGHALVVGQWGFSDWVADNGQYIENKSAEQVAKHALDATAVWSRCMT